MIYPDGQSVLTGDEVWIDRRQRRGVIEVVIDTPELREDYYLDPEENGILIKSDFYGRLLVPFDYFIHDEISLIARGDANNPSFT